MRKMYTLLILLFMTFGLNACQGSEVNEPHNGSGEYFVLPDLNGKDVDDIIELFEFYEQEYTIEIFDQENELLENQFIMYKNFNTNDFVDKKEDVIIVVYPEFSGIRTRVRLPELTGLNEEQIEDIFDMYEVGVSFSYTELISVENEGLFSHYGSGYEVGDEFYLTSNVSIIMFETLNTGIEYFEPISIEYDGPFLNEEYAEVGLVNPRGGYFDTTLNYCIDGDTAVFDYPSEVYASMGSSSVRFLNIDTAESTRQKEEWGKPGSLYTCSMLMEAEEIRLQTDAGHGITGTYGRLLAWVWIKLPGEEEFFLLNYMIAQQGLAQVKYGSDSAESVTYNGLPYNDWMLMAEQYAQANELGQWGDLKDYYWDYENDVPNYNRW